jgi:hypothetical protein
LDFEQSSPDLAVRVLRDVWLERFTIEWLTDQTSPIVQAYCLLCHRDLDGLSYR